MQKNFRILCTAVFVLALFAVLMGDLSAPARETAMKWILGLSLTGVIASYAVKGRRSVKEGAAGNFEMKRAQSPVTFAGVAANEEARESLNQLVKYLQDPERYKRMGARMPRGVLLYGPPGTGKTLLARALAGEAGVPFYAMAGSDFVEMYAGVGAKRVRELFRNAEKDGKCVIFIDEIDAIGKKRDGHASDERDQTLNALLAEMSGFRMRDGVIVMAATNRLDALDPALIRPGRFDRKIEVGLPERKERLSILELITKDKPLREDVDLPGLANATVAFSGASLEALVNEAAILAANRESQSITPADLEKAYLRQVAGAERQRDAADPRRSMIALHEAGHAVISDALLPENEIRRVSILPTGGAMAGYNLTIPRDDTLMTKHSLENQICVLLGGRAAEALIAGEMHITAGASGDLQRATEIAVSMKMDLGMADSMSASMRVLQKSGMACGGEDVKVFLDDMFARTTRILCEKQKQLMNLTQALVDHEALSGRQVRAILRSEDAA